MRLNYDIFLLVMQYAPRGVVANLMGTCRYLNAAGARHLFKDPIVLSTEKQAKSFALLLRTPDATSRRTHLAQLVCRLTIALGPDQLTDDATLAIQCIFADVVPSLPNLTHLEIERSEELLCAKPEIGETVAALTGLRRIKVTEAGELSCNMLHFLSSPVLYAHVYLQHDKRAGDPRLRCPGQFLRNVHTTLQTLSVDRSNAFYAFDPVFQHVRSLSMRHTHIRVYAQLVRVCPGLQHLRISEHTSRDLWPTVEDMRNVNMLSTQASWPALRSYSGSIKALYMLALRCPIIRLDLEDEQHATVVVRPAALQQVLLDSTPTHLTFRGLWTGTSTYYTNDNVIATLSEPGLWRWPLRTLEFVIRFRGCDGHVDVSELLPPPGEATFRATFDLDGYVDRLVCQVVYLALASSRRTDPLSLSPAEAGRDTTSGNHAAAVQGPHSSVPVSQESRRRLGGDTGSVRFGGLHDVQCRDLPGDDFMTR
ncbi:hypothetical protein C8Q76DRAFT_697422 [Earliella scabrosa]|nr:hypothetical protein C8Q76DRAFT_697422 [Earliella scabrosa]